MKKNGKGRKEQPPVFVARAQTCMTRSSEQRKDDWQAGVIVPAVKVAAEIMESDYFNCQGRNIRIRLTHWLDILSKPQFNSTWRANKLNYLKLLNLMCQCEILVPPFTSFPDPNNLPLLQNHQINQIIDEVQRQIKAMLPTQQEREHSLTMQKRKHSVEKTKPTPTSGSSKDISRARTKLEIDEVYWQKEFKMDQRDTDKQDNKVIVHTNEPASKKKSRGNKPHLTALRIDRSCSQKSRFSLTSNRPSGKAMKRDNAKYSISFSISPLTVSSILWQHQLHDQPYLNQTINCIKTVRNNHKQQRFRHSNQPAVIDSSASRRMEYWQSNSHTGNATPKYLYNYRQAAHVVQCQQHSQTPTDRSIQKFCDCLGVLYGAIS